MKDTSIRTNELFEEQQHSITKHTDHLFARLMLWQWLAGVVLAILVSPHTWAGAQSQVHLHVLAAVFLGGIITAFPVWLALKYPGQTMTRHTIAVGQALM